MADGVWKGVPSLVIERSDQLLLNVFLDQSTPSMRKGRDGKKNGMGVVENNGENNGPLTSLPVDRLMVTNCNANR